MTADQAAALAAFLDRSLGDARRRAAQSGHESVDAAAKASRCYTEDTCTMDQACPFHGGCEAIEESAR